MYTRRQVTDHVTKMNKDLYDNLQDGIDEAKFSIEEMFRYMTLLFSNDNEFSEDRQYKLGDLVIQEGVLYRCILPVEIPGPWNLECWEQTSLLETLEILSANFTNAISGIADALIAKGCESLSADATVEEIIGIIEQDVFLKTKSSSASATVPALGWVYNTTSKIGISASFTGAAFENFNGGIKVLYDCKASITYSASLGCEKGKYLYIHLYINDTKVASQSWTHSSTTKPIVATKTINVTRDLKAGDVLYAYYTATATNDTNNYFHGGSFKVVTL